MYDVAPFVKFKREDWDNGCGPTERADLDALRYARTRSPVADEIRKAFRMGIADCPNIVCDANSDHRCCAFALCAAMRPNAPDQRAANSGTLNPVVGKGE